MKKTCKANKNKRAYRVFEELLEKIRKSPLDRSYTEFGTRATGPGGYGYVMYARFHPGLIKAWEWQQAKFEKALFRLIKEAGYKLVSHYHGVDSGDTSHYYLFFAVERK